MFRLATSILSPGGARGRLSAFIFHRVLPAPDPLQPSEPHAEQFDAMLGWIGSQFNVLPPLEACERLYAKSLPPRAAIITFDDGYRDNHDIALPLLKKHGMTAVFFVATGYLDGGVMFNDRVIEAVRKTRLEHLDARQWGAGTLPLGSIEQRREAIARLLVAIKHLEPDARNSAVEAVEASCGPGVDGDLMMTSEQVAALASEGMQIGGHTRGHPILRSLEDGSAEHDIRAGRDDLRAITGQAPVLFAYPNGRIRDDFEPRHAQMARRAGFAYGFTTHGGASSSGEDPMLLRRHTPWARRRVRFQGQALRNLAPSRSEAIA